MNNHNGHRVTYQGIEYANKKELATAYGIKYATLISATRNCDDIEYALDKLLNKRKIKYKYTYKGVGYNSLNKLGDDLGIVPGSISSLMGRWHMSLDEAVSRLIAIKNGKVSKLSKVKVLGQITKEKVIQENLFATKKLVNFNA